MHDVLDGCQSERTPTWYRVWRHNRQQKRLETKPSRRVAKSSPRSYRPRENPCSWWRIIEC
ncbi:unnamed protein product [Leptidea sinapis]|uniref:Uncharacterized protein n=1 Tax=Leptidea sinapis TaxID=189913 RepID=A0A5E4PSP5_9NEOP|nr:unnamed protein product [Leptidea sinapis]